MPSVLGDRAQRVVHAALATHMRALCLLHHRLPPFTFMSLLPLARFHIVALPGRWSLHGCDPVAQLVRAGLHALTSSSSSLHDAHESCRSVCHVEPLLCAKARPFTSKRTRDGDSQEIQLRSAEWSTTSVRCCCCSHDTCLRENCCCYRRLGSDVLCEVASRRQRSHDGATLANATFSKWWWRRARGRAGLANQPNAVHFPTQQGLMGSS
jgi:hypothetical protein